MWYTKIADYKQTKDKIQRGLASNDKEIHERGNKDLHAKREQSVETGKCLRPMYFIVKYIVLNQRGLLLPPTDASEFAGRYYFHRRVSFCQQGVFYLPTMPGAGRHPPIPQVTNNRRFQIWFHKNRKKSKNISMSHVGHYVESASFLHGTFAE